MNTSFVDKQKYHLFTIYVKDDIGQTFYYPSDKIPNNFENSIVIDTFYFKETYEEITKGLCDIENHNNLGENCQCKKLLSNKLAIYPKEILNKSVTISGFIEVFSY